MSSPAGLPRLMNDISSAPTRPLSGVAGFADAVDNLVASDEKVR